MSEINIPSEIQDKISMFCNVEKRYVIEERDLQLSIYGLPVVLHKKNLDGIVIEYLGLKQKM
jgi:CTP synthase